MQIKHFFLYEKKILIYAAGSIGKRVLNVCSENRLSVEGFIDERAGEIGVYQDYNVYSLEQAEAFEGKKEYAVIITVRNVFEHSAIAERLRHLGFMNLIYKPYNVLSGHADNTECDIFDAHEMLTEQGEVYAKEIPVSHLLGIKSVRETWFIEEKNENIKCYVPAELLFTNEKKSTLYNGINLMMIHPVIPLFRAFDIGDTEALRKAIDVYVNEFAKVGAQGIKIKTGGLWEQNVLNGRKKVFSEMAAMQALSDSFFTEYCPGVEWRQDMRLSLQSSGKSRACFLMARNIAYVPVCINKDEWQRFYHADAVKEIIDFFCEHGITELFAPLPHPAFMNMEHKCYNYKFLWLERTGRFLSRYIYEQIGRFCFSEYSALYAMEDLGITERLYMSQGICAYRYKKSNTLENLCDKLFYYTPKNYQNEWMDFSFVSMEYRGELADILHHTLHLCFLLDDQDIGLTSGEIAGCGFRIEKVLFTAYWADKEICGLALRREVENE